MLFGVTACSQDNGAEIGVRKDPLRADLEVVRDPEAPGDWAGKASNPSAPLTATRLPNGNAPLHDVQRIAQLAGVNEAELRLLNESRITFRHLRHIVTRYKYLNTVTGESSSLALYDDGNLADYGALAEAEKQMKYAVFGTVYPPLHKRLTAAVATELIGVMLKMRVPQRMVDRELGDEEFLKREGELVQREVEERARQLLGESLRRLGISVLPEDDLLVSGPFITAKFAASDVLLLGKAEEVVFVGPYFDEDVEDTTGSWTYTDLDDALAVTRTDLTHGAGFKGDGVRLAVMETGQSDVNLDCFDVAARQTTSGSVNTHMTNSMFIWGNTDHNFNGSCTGDEVGYAPDARILMANGGSSNTSSYASRYQWAKDNSVDVVSMSFHADSEEDEPELHSRDIYFDYWTTQSPYPVVFTSAGNQGEEGAYASGKGYNILGVGNSALDSTLTDRCDDDMFEESSYKNPDDSANDDRELPPIAAPGHRHNVYDRSFGGTSAATPVAAAIGALLLDQASQFNRYPEAVRAIMLATANYQDGDGDTWGGGDGRDGVGLVNSHYSRMTATTREQTTSHQFRAHDYGLMLDDDFNSSKTYEKTWTVWNTGAPIRVAVTWDSKTTETASELDLDLDLFLYNSSGTLVAVSNTWDNSYEFIEYTPPSSTGDYTIKLKAHGTIPSDLYTYYSVAWTVHYDCQ